MEGGTGPSLSFSLEPFSHPFQEEDPLSASLIEQEKEGDLDHIQQNGQGQVQGHVESRQSGSQDRSRPPTQAMKDQKGADWVL